MGKAVWSSYQQEPVEFEGQRVYDIGAFPAEPLSGGRIGDRVVEPRKRPQSEAEQTAVERMQQMVREMRKRQERIRNGGDAVVTHKNRILFLCTGNSCRSQMAEGWARSLKTDQIEPYSAGIETHGVNPLAVQVMAEAGVDISRHRSKHVSELLDISFDYVVTVCDHASAHCPRFPRAVKHVHAGFDDPPALAKQAKTQEEALGHYRRVRDEIRSFIETLPQALEGPHDR